MFDDGDEIFSDEDKRPADSIFNLHGEPLPIYLHPSLSRGGSMAIAKKIEDAGGNPYATVDEANVIICRYGTPIFSELEYIYDHDRDKWVEPPSWVDTCIALGRCEHYLPGKTDKREKRHNARTPFSLEDDEHLVQFLAHRIPYKSSGGRLGNGVYKDLCDERRATRYPWAKHHPWQSWRDRYTKNQLFFDERIDHKVNHQSDPPMPGDKGQYMIPRKARKPQPLRYNVFEEEEEQEEQEEQFRQDRPRQEEEEAESGAIVDKSHITTKKSSRPDLRDRRTERNQLFPSPPRKRPRISVVPSHFEAADPSVGIAQDKGKGKERLLRSDLEFERPRDMAPDDVSPAKYNDTQITLVAPTPRHPKSNTAPPETPAAIVLASPRRVSTSERPQRAARKGASREPAQQRSVAYNTRSRRPPENRFFQLGVSQPVPDKRRLRGRPQKPPVPPVNVQETAVSAVNVSPGEEVQVEEILQVSEEKESQAPLERDRDGGSSSGESLSSEDGEATQMLRDANKQMIDEGIRSRSRPRNVVGATPNLREVPFIDISRETVRPSSHLAVPRQPASTSPRRADPGPGPDPDATPRARPFDARRAAKKTAAAATRESPSNPDDSDGDPNSNSNSNSDDADSDSGLQSSGTSGSSFPVEATNAREYLNAQGPYTPAPGTKASEHIRSGRMRKGRRASTGAR